MSRSSADGPLSNDTTVGSRGEHPWLHVVGIGEEGLAGLAPATRALVESAEVILGGDRHHALAPHVTAERLAWPSPFDAMIETIRGLRGRRAVVLVTGDPLWYSAGARIARGIPAEEIVFHPQLSAFQLAAARLGWSLADCDTLTVHGRPVEQVLPFVQPGRRLLVLTTGGETPAKIAKLLTERGFGGSRISVFAALNGPEEARFDGTAETWDHMVPDFNTLAVECRAGAEVQLAPRVPGLDDGLFRSDGKMTKREVRSLTLAKLMPMPGALLWDVGAGSGSIGIEWIRAARDARAVGIEPRADRRAMAAENALALGAPRFELIDGRAPQALAELEAPDAVFLGGGFSEEVFDTAWAALKPLGRLVAHAVTLESEAEMLRLHAKHGGELTRIAVQRAETVGSRTGWRPSMPVTQWSLVKR